LSLYNRTSLRHIDTPLVLSEFPVNKGFTVSFVDACDGEISAAFRARQLQNCALRSEATMKSRNSNLFVAVTSLCLLSTPAWLMAQQPEQQKLPPVHYHITDLGTLGGPYSSAFSVSDPGFVSGEATLANGTGHAILWYQGKNLDIGAPGLGTGGAATLNSIAYTVNGLAQAVGSAEPSTRDKDSENFCSFGSGLQCLPFRWQGGVMTALPTLGGKNGAALSINDFGQVAGVAEEDTEDAGCVAPQAHRFEAVVWQPAKGGIQSLRPFPGDSVGAAVWINDKGQVVGVSGSCGDTQLPPLVGGPRAVLWENGSVIDLGNLGGACLNGCKSAALGVFGNTALFISNQGEVFGGSALEGEQTFHAFSWTKRTGKMQDLGTVPGDYASIALAANDQGEIVGLSIDKTGVPRAFLRRNGVMLDLNTLLPTNSPIHALVAQFINLRGEITGFGVNASGQTHAFLATPCP
jgi:probable HAF family extracellular repeat protein